MPASAQQRSAYVFAGKPLTFSHLYSQNGREAIGINDPGLRALLEALGATVTWQSGERYVLVTTAQPIVVSFAVGDTRYDVGPVEQQAPFAPFIKNGEAYVPLDELVRALDLAPKRDGSDVVLQPQLAGIDIRSSGGGTQLVAHAAVPIDAHIVSATGDRIVLAFEGLGTTLERSRRVQASGLREIDIRTEGTVRDPRTLVTLALVPGTAHGPPSTDDQRDFTMGFGSAIAGQPAATPEQPADQTATVTPAPAQASGVTVDAVTGSATAAGYHITIAVSGNATYEWHRLRPPDNRWYVDIHEASLGMAPSDQTGEGPVQTVRVRQAADRTVRVALSLTDYDTVDVRPTDSGLTIDVSGTAADVANAPKSGSGTIGSSAIANAPAGDSNDAWKFSPRPEDSAKPYAAQNPRLIVIDPGHGGSDGGTVRGGLEEKNLTLDMAKRLRTLLVGRGWQVTMTRDTDKDVFGPYDSAHDELQARVDIGNHAGARMFVSIHVNGFINSGPHGTTTYYSKPSDVPFAKDVERRLATTLGTSDDGIVKSKLYVTLHSAMPAILVETAFLTNPDDFAKLASADWRQKVAQAIADGIGDYAGAPPAGSQDSGQ